MPKKGMSESIKVASPCSEPWDEMQGNDAVRFCTHCQKNVNNISTMSPGKRGGSFADRAATYASDMQLIQKQMSRSMPKSSIRSQGVRQP